MKSKYTFLKIFILVFAIIKLASCSDSWLEPKAYSFYEPGTVLVDQKGFEAVIAACARSMRGEWYGDGSPIITEYVFSESAVEGTTDKASPSQDLNKQILPSANLNSPNTTRVGWYWREGYYRILNTNMVISRIDQVTNFKSDDVKNSILGQAYFFRAYTYYRLTHQFGDVVLMLKETTTPRLDFYSTKREVILQQMKEDLEFATKWVPDIMDAGEVNKAACYHLLAKVNLALGDFDGAIKAASAVIDNPQYKLMTTRFGVDANNSEKNVVWDLHRPLNKADSKNTESILIVTDRLNVEGNVSGGTTSMRQVAPYYYGPNVLTPSGFRGLSDSHKIEFPIVNDYGRGLGRCRGTWYSTNMIWENDNDLRHSHPNWMMMEDLIYNNPALKNNALHKEWYGKNLMMYNEDGKITVSDTIRSWYAWPHYKVFVEDPERVQYWGGHSDWYVFRLAETYLLRAEAYLWKKDAALAMADINKVRGRAGARLFKESEVNMETLLDERARELYFEEPRKTELTRISYLYAKTGMADYKGRTYKVENFSEENYFYNRIMDYGDFYNKGVKTNYGNEYTVSPFHVLWPIPLQPIDANAHGVINQNIGYPGAENNVPPLSVIE